METMASTTKRDVLTRVATRLAARAAAAPVLRVAIDGPDGAGKTTFARQLADILAPLLPAGAEVRRFDIDMFMVPAHVRRSDAAADPRWLYDHAYDLARVRAVAEGPDDCPRGTVILVDGMGLLRPELADLWDVSLYLFVTEETTMRRVRARPEFEDGGADLERLYRERYLPALRIYRDAVDPAGRADVLIDMHDYDKPVVVRWGALGT